MLIASQFPAPKGLRQAASHPLPRPQLRWGCRFLPDLIQGSLQFIFDLLTDHEWFYYTRVINECAWGLRRRRAQECAPYRHTVVGRAVLCTPFPRNDLGRSE